VSEGRRRAETPAPLKKLPGHRKQPSDSVGRASLPASGRRMAGTEARPTEEKPPLLTPKKLKQHVGFRPGVLIISVEGRCRAPSACDAPSGGPTELTFCGIIPN